METTNQQSALLIPNAYSLVDFDHDLPVLPVRLALLIRSVLLATSGSGFQVNLKKEIGCAELTRYSLSIGTGSNATDNLLDIGLWPSLYSTIDNGSRMRHLKRF
ncbi:hypothetical protein FGLOB1_6163 [Fusarium globosum]|uniref:Uncharacterized protein n=1 Tax=Fusarium globosum TaxID=78864 RepID=A0A8H6D9C6_9HYPO|nr:hypothetical protein FGLOB1_6163 [Fusarium globosum]